MRTVNEEKVSEGNTGEHTEGLKTLDEGAIKDDKLVDVVENRMDFLRDVQNSTEPDEVDEELDTSTPDVPEDEPEEEDGQAAVESETNNTESKADDSTDGSTQDAPVSIPDAYVRAAVHQGWEKADVDELVKANPELALKTLTSCYNSVTAAGKEWSALGRARIDSLREAAETGNVEPEDASIEPLLSKLKESYADDPLIDVVSKLLKANAAKPKASTPVANNQQQQVDLYRTETQRATASANASIDQRVNSFFSDTNMGPYEEFYGKLSLSQTVGDLANGQQLHRAQVMEEAECIMTGMRMRGIDLPIEQVLEKAHLIVTEPIREQVIRNDLKKKATNRTKTLRPSKSKKSGSAATQGNNVKPRNRQELLSKVGQKLAQTFK